MKQGETNEFVLYVYFKWVAQRNNEQAKYSECWYHDSVFHFKKTDDANEIGMHHDQSGEMLADSDLGTENPWTTVYVRFGVIHGIVAIHSENARVCTGHYVTDINAT